MLLAHVRHKTSEYARMLARGAPRLPDCARSSSSATSRRARVRRSAGTTCRRGCGVGARRRSRQRPERTQFDEAINIQYTSGTTGFPKGATLSHHNILNNGFFIGEGCRLHRARPRLHSGSVLPLLRDGAGQPRCIDARRRDGHPGRRLRSGRDARGHRSASAARRSTACPRCSSRSSRCRTSRLRPLVAAHRHHGRLTLPVEVMKRVQTEMHMPRDHDLLRHDRNLAGHRRRPLTDDPLREADRDRRPRASARRGQDRRRGRRIVPRGSRASCARAATA